MDKIRKSPGPRSAYGEKTKSMKVPISRIDSIKLFLTLVPADVDNPLEYLKEKTREVESLLEALKKQVK
ncbi:MAG: hypothetical protein PHP00_06750 [Thiotrichaceae bacterium]|nr:hypothetical protein [Thiotrichaceae bacterium]